MPEDRDSPLTRFIASSPYTALVDKKRLRFVYDAIMAYSTARDIKVAGLDILEVACGDGGVTLAMASLGGAVTAFDISTESVETLRAELIRRGLMNVTLTIDNGYDFDDGRLYDIVVASEVFEHVLEPERLAANIKRRMKPGGYLIVSTPNGWGPWEWKKRLDLRNHLRKWNLLRRFLKKPLYVRGAGSDHCQFYTRGRLESLFREQSFRQLAFRNSDSFVAIFSFLRGNERMARADLELADRLPHTFASGWFLLYQLSATEEPARDE